MNGENPKTGKKGSKRSRDVFSDEDDVVEGVAPSKRTKTVRILLQFDLWFNHGEALCVFFAAVSR